MPQCAPARDVAQHAPKNGRRRSRDAVHGRAVVASGSRAAVLELSNGGNKLLCAWHALLGRVLLRREGEGLGLVHAPAKRDDLALNVSLGGGLEVRSLWKRLGCIGVAGVLRVAWLLLTPNEGTEFCPLLLHVGSSKPSQLVSTRGDAIVPVYPIHAERLFAPLCVLKANGVCFVCGCCAWMTRKGQRGIGKKERGTQTQTQTHTQTHRHRHRQTQTQTHRHAHTCTQTCTHMHTQYNKMETGGRWLVPTWEDQGGTVCTLENSAARGRSC